MKLPSASKILPVSMASIVVVGIGLAPLAPLLQPVKSVCEFAHSDLPSFENDLGVQGSARNGTKLQQHLAFFDSTSDGQLTVAEIFRNAQMLDCFAMSPMQCKLAVVKIALIIGTFTRGHPSLSIDLTDAALRQAVHRPSDAGVYGKELGEDVVASKIDAFFSSTDVDKDGVLSGEEVAAFIDRKGKSNMHKKLMGGEFPMLLKMANTVGTQINRATVDSLYDGSFLYEHAEKLRLHKCEDADEWVSKQTLATRVATVVGDRHVTANQVQQRADQIGSILNSWDLTEDEEAQMRRVVDVVVAGGEELEAVFSDEPLMQAVRTFRTMYTKIPTTKPGMVGVPLEMGPVQRLDLDTVGLGRGAALKALPFEYSAKDEDAYNNAEGVKLRASELIVDTYGTHPINDTSAEWESAMQAEAVVHSVFDLFYPRTKIKYSHHQEHAGSDAGLTQLFFYATGSDLVERLPTGGRLTCHSALIDATPVSDGSVELCAAGAPSGAAYVVDMHAIKQYGVRRGFEAYGAVAAFDDAKQVMAIYVSYMAQWVRPGDEQWEHAKYVLRASCLTYVTAVQHLLHLHLVFSNPMQLGLREALPAGHAIRRMLKPYVFRSGTINSAAAKLLIPPLALAHRMFGLTYDGLASMLADGFAHFEFESFPEQLVRRGLLAKSTDDASADVSMPMVQDGLPLYRRLERYVSEYVAQHLDGEDGRVAPAADADLQRLWAHLQPSMKLGEWDGGRKLVDVLTTHIFSVTAKHELLGDVSAECLSPYLVGKVRKGAVMADAKTSFQTALTIALTSTPMPKLVEYYTHLHVDQAAKRSHEALLADLTDLSATVRHRNAERPYPFPHFDPLELECSVSV